MFSRWTTKVRYPLRQSTGRFGNKKVTEQLTRDLLSCLKLTDDR
jgi:hypothetical protein